MRRRRPQPDGWVLANCQECKVFDRRTNTGRAEALLEFTPTGQAGVGGEFEKRKIPPPCVTAQGSHACDLHFTGLPRLATLLLHPSQSRPR